MTWQEIFKNFWFVENKEEQSWWAVDWPLKLRNRLREFSLHKVIIMFIGIYLPDCLWLVYSSFTSFFLGWKLKRFSWNQRQFKIQLHTFFCSMVLVRVHNAIIEGLTSQGFNGQLTKFSFSKHTIFFLHQHHHLVYISKAHVLKMLMKILVLENVKFILKPWQIKKKQIFVGMLTAHVSGEAV